MSKSDEEHLKDLVTHIKTKSDEECLEFFENGDRITENAALSYSFQCDTTPNEGEDMEELIGHTILHLAVCYKKYKSATSIAKKFPKLIVRHVGEYPENKRRYLGLTPLLIAIAHGNENLVEEMFQTILNYSSQDKVKRSLTLRTRLRRFFGDLSRVGCAPFRQNQIGMRMKGTVFMGQLPLTIAVLCCISNFYQKPEIEPDTDSETQSELKMVEVLLKQKGIIEILQTNYLGDTVLHSIMRYVMCFPADEVRAVTVTKLLIDKYIDYAGNTELPPYENLHKEQRSKLENILSIRNKDGKTAFQLAAESGHVNLYRYFLQLSSLSEPHDRIYQIGRCDVTEIEQHQSGTPAIVELICCQPLSTSIQMVAATDVFDKFVTLKWNAYRIMFSLLFLVHLSIVTLLCIYVPARAHVIKGQNWAPPNFDLGCSVLCIFVALIYIFQECIRTFVSKQIMAWTAFHHNVVFRFLTFVFSICLLIDSVLWLASSCNVNFFLILALLSGTWNLMFFLRAVPYFGVYIVLINEALIKALLPFAVISCLQLVVFSVSMHSVFIDHNDTEPVEEFTSFGKSMLNMGKLMLGLSEFDFLLKAREDYLAVFLFFLFLVVTFLLLINALISVMTNRFTDPQQDRLRVECLQKMSVIIYLEGLFVGCLRGKIFHAGKKEESSNRYTFSYKKVPSSQADNPSGIEHKLRKEFKKNRDTMQDISKRLADIQDTLSRMGGRTLGTSHTDGRLKELDDHEKRVNEVLDLVTLRDDRDRNLHIYHFERDDCSDRL